MLSFKHIEQALNLPDFDGFKAQMAMAPAVRERMFPDPDNPPRQSAVLVLIYPKSGEGLQIILTKRTDRLRGHSGQVSFPGGSRDEDDDSFEHTALRETCEEIGICEQSQISLIGRLTSMWIPPSNFEVVPIVATMQYEPEMTLSPAEVDRVLHMPLDALLDDTIKKTTEMTFRDTVFDVPYYEVDEQIVWGATAGMLRELELRLKIVLDS